MAPGLPYPIPPKTRSAGLRPPAKTPGAVSPQRTLSVCFAWSQALSSKLPASDAFDVTVDWGANREGELLLKNHRNAGCLPYPELVYSLSVPNGAQWRSMALNGALEWRS